jgi:hypothetical protein
MMKPFPAAALLRQRHLGNLRQGAHGLFFGRLGVGEIETFLIMGQVAIVAEIEEVSGHMASSAQGCCVPPPELRRSRMVPMKSGLRALVHKRHRY